MGKPLGYALRRLVVLPLPLALVVAGCAGCGNEGGDAATATTEPAADEPAADEPSSIASSSTSRPDQFAGATAAGLLLVPEDLGSSWAPGVPWYGTVCDDEVNPENSLTAGEPPEVDLARTTVQSGEISIIEAVALFATPAMAQQRLDGWRNTMTTCTNRVSVDTDPVQTFHMSPSDLGPYGEESWLSALTVDVGGEPTPGIEVVYRRGRALVHVKILSFTRTLSDDRTEELMEYVLAKAAPA